MGTLYTVHGKIELFLPGSHSLKERRKVINSVKGRLQSRFNISVVDVSEDKVWQRASLGFAMAFSKFSRIEESLELIDRLLGHNPEFEVLEFQYELTES